MKKNLLIFGLFLLIGIYFGIKAFCLYFYNSALFIEEAKETFDGLSIRNEITIKKKTLSDSNYFQFQNIKIKNIFQNFEKMEYPHSTDEFEKYVIYDEYGRMKTSFWVGITDSYVELLTSSDLLYGTNRVTNKDLMHYFKKKHIKNDIELFSYLNRKKLKENTIFTSIHNMKENYITSSVLAGAIPKLDGITIIKGDYIGYILHIKDKFKEVSILKDGKRYVFTFIDLDYFNEKVIEELLSTIIIEKE